LKKAVIIGALGQDGQLLTALLNSKKYSVIGIDINYVSAPSTLWQGDVDISDKDSVFNLVKNVEPDEIYYLAAYHHSSEEDIINEDDLIQKSYQVNVFSYINFLEAIRIYSPSSKIFYASSSHIFGHPKNDVQNEETKIDPKSIYSITKYDSQQLSRYYRENYSLFCSVGILYTHESSLRTEKFISKRIVTTAIEIKNNKVNELIIGDLNAKIDWGYAGDYVEAFVKILNIESADEFIIATGKTHELKDFIIYVFEYLSLDWKKYVREDSSLLKRRIQGVYCGDPSKIKSLTGWNPNIDLKSLAHLMVDKELQNKG